MLKNGHWYHVGKLPRHQYTAVATTCSSEKCLLNTVQQQAPPPVYLTTQCLQQHFIELLKFVKVDG